MLGSTSYTLVSHFAVDVVERPLADGAHGSSAGPLQNAGIKEKVPAPAHGSLVMLSWQIGHIRLSEASSGVAWGSWLVLAAGEEVPSLGESSSDAISHCTEDTCRQN